MPAHDRCGSKSGSQADGGISLPLRTSQPGSDSYCAFQRAWPHADDPGGRGLSYRRSRSMAAEEENGGGGVSYGYLELRAESVPLPDWGGNHGRESKELQHAGGPADLRKWGKIKTPSSIPP